MDKLKLIIKREFLAKVKNKSFIVMTILSPLLMVGFGLLIVFLNQKNSEEVRTVAFVDESNLLASVFTDSNAIKYLDLSPLGIQEARKQTEAGRHPDLPCCRWQSYSSGRGQAIGCKVTERSTS